LIDWVLGSIIFQQLSQHESKGSPFVEILDPVLDLLNPIPPVKPRKPLRVTFINSAVYSHASRLEGLKCFQLCISLPKVIGHSTTTSKIMINMSTIAKDYYDFADIFSKYKAGKLADHQPYNLKITLDGGTSPWSCNDLISPFYYILSSLLSLLISLFQPFSQLYSCFYYVVGAVSKAINGDFP